MHFHPLFRFEYLVDNENYSLCRKITRLCSRASFFSHYRSIPKLASRSTFLFRTRRTRKFRSFPHVSSRSNCSLLRRTYITFPTIRWKWTTAVATRYSRVRKIRMEEKKILQRLSSRQSNFKLHASKKKKEEIVPVSEIRNSFRKNDRFRSSLKTHTWMQFTWILLQRGGQIEIRKVYLLNNFRRNRTASLCLSTAISHVL